MAVHLQNEIENLKKKILHLGALVEESLNLAVRSLESRDPRPAQWVIDGDTLIDRMEVELEEDCLKVLALHQPVAVDLRFIVAVLKINAELERIGDLAVNVAERQVFLASREPLAVDFDYRAMARDVMTMVRESLEALVRLDVALARRVMAADDAVDAQFAAMFGTLQRAVAERPDRLLELLSYLSVARYLERTADHAVNVAEDVIYLVEGEIVRHRPPPTAPLV